MWFVIISLSRQALILTTEEEKTKRSISSTKKKQLIWIKAETINNQGCDNNCFIVWVFFIWQKTQTLLQIHLFVLCQT